MANLFLLTSLSAQILEEKGLAWRDLGELNVDKDYLYPSDTVIPCPVDNGESFCNPNPHIQGKNMNKHMAPKLSSLPVLKHFGSYLVQIFVHIFAL